MTKLTASKLTASKAPAKAPAKVASPKDGPKKIEKLIASEPTAPAPAKEVKSLTAMVAKTGAKTLHEGKVTVDRKNEARPGTARHTAIATAQSCKTGAELYGKLTANWVNWLVKEGYVSIGA